MTNLETNKQLLVKPYSRYLVDVENWMVHEKQSEEVITQKLVAKNVPNEVISILLEHGRTSIMKASERNALIYLITGFAAFVLGLLLNIGTMSSAGIGFKIFGGMMVFGFVAMIRGAYYFIQLKRIKDITASRAIAEKLGKI